MVKRGKREFVQVLRLLEVFRREDVLAGVREAIARGAMGYDAVKPRQVGIDRQIEPRWPAPQPTSR
jgi:hypothetical protein